MLPPMSGSKTVEEGQLLWSPSEDRQAQSNMHRFSVWLRQQGIADVEGYEALWQWSVEQPAAFWEAIWHFFEVKSHSPYTEVLGGDGVSDARWFEGATLNYAEHALSWRRPSDDIAIIARREDGSSSSLSYGELFREVARAASGLREIGVRRGDRVAAFLPNVPEAVVAFLATASIGAIWSSCAPEFGVGSVLDRFRQLEPRVLIAVDSYVYGGKVFDRREQVAEIRAGLPSLETVVALSRSGERLDELGGGPSIPWRTLLEKFTPLTYSDLKEGLIPFMQPVGPTSCPLYFEPVPFDHPLWVLYSSGTTGLPKAIVHSHGGILLELFKALSLHSDLGRDDRFFWFSTTGWMMWNYLIGGLLLGSTVVLYDGSPGWPDLDALWAMAAETEATYFGASAPFLLACRKAGLCPRERYDLSRLRGVGSTGAPLPAEGFAWVYESVGDDLLLGSVSGGTDVCTAFVLSSPLLPVYAGEIQCAGLGAKVEAWSPEGEPVRDQVGELVITKPLPSMPVGFLNDPDGERYRSSYFSVFPEVWRHGDWVKHTSRGTYVIYGRSDSTLNRGGVRMGTSEFYRVVDSIPQVLDSVVVDTSEMDREGRLWLFVVLAEGESLSESLIGELQRTLRSQLSPRHVPDEIRQVAGVPRTLSGKKLEVPIKRILNGVDPAKAVSRDTLANPEALDVFLALAPRG